MSTVLRRKIVVVLFIGIVTSWAVLGCACWSGFFRSQVETISLVKIFRVSMLLTTWPAHELLLELSGKGFGANALSKFDIASLSIFFAYSAIIWGPLLILLRKKRSIFIALSAQSALLVLVSILFWYYGNG